MTDFLQARDMWAALSIPERKKLIERVHGDAAMADHDWAGLPPQAHSAIIATMQPEPAAKAPRKRHGSEDE